jgi:two-component system, LytTR family, sensor kinase
VGKNANLSKYLVPVIHILFWMLIFILPHILRGQSPTARFSENAQYRMLINNILLIILFYANAFYLFPVVYKRQGLATYLISLVCLLLVLFTISNYIEKDVFPPRRHWKIPYFGNLFMSLFIIGISCSYSIISDNARKERALKEKENENLKTELSFLRSQVSPHFMFNILNNLVSLARKKSDLLEPSLIQLSGLMRYMLYDSDGRISLKQEIDYLKSYIDLQMLRFGEDVDLKMNIDEEGAELYQIEPMLLIAFVENAFKHGVGLVEKPAISIVLDINKDSGMLDFAVSNTVSPATETKDKSSGIGLANVRRRLELLYAEQHELLISNNGNRFKVDLKLALI